MITTRQAAKPAPVQDDRRDAIRTLYLESLQLVERLHRRLLDVIKDEFDRNGRPTSTPSRPCCCSTSAMPS
jgi:hypothetical protein